MSKMQLQSHTISAKQLLGFAVAAIIAFLLLISVINIAQKYFGLRREIRDLKAEQARLQAKERSLGSTNDYLNTPEGREQALRDKYNVVKPGEGMIVITPSEIPPEPTARKSIVVRWWESVLRGLGLHKE